MVEPLGIMLQCSNRHLVLRSLHRRLVFLTSEFVAATTGMMNGKRLAWKGWKGGLLLYIDTPTALRLPYCLFYLALRTCCVSLFAIALNSCVYKWCCLLVSAFSPFPTWLASLTDRPGITSPTLEQSLPDVLRVRCRLDTACFGLRQSLVGVPSVCRTLGGPRSPRVGLDIRLQNRK